MAPYAQRVGRECVSVCVTWNALFTIRMTNSSVSVSDLPSGCLHYCKIHHQPKRHILLLLTLPKRKVCRCVDKFSKMAKIRITMTLSIVSSRHSNLIGSRFIIQPWSLSQLSQGKGGVHPGQVASWVKVYK